MKVENGALGGAEHRLQTLADHSNGATPAVLAAIADDGVDALLRTNDEEAAERIDSHRQTVVEVAEIDDEQLPADP